MSSLRDGLGGEELQVSGLQTGGTNISPYFTGSVNAASGFTDNLGTLAKSISLGSPGNFGAFVQAGSLGTAAGSGGFLQLRTPYTSNYAVMMTPFSGTSTQAFASGVQNLTSGVNVVGGASGRYFWMTVGI